MGGFSFPGGFSLAGGGGAPTGAAGGSLGSTYPNPTVVTNANLTGPITSVGNATSIASQTGTGSTFVMSAAPTITGTASFSGQINTNQSPAVSAGNYSVAAGSARLFLQSNVAVHILGNATSGPIFDTVNTIFQTNGWPIGLSPSGSGVEVNINRAGNGLMLLTDSSGTSFGRIMLGGATSSYPSIKRSSATLAFRLADDSADAAITAAAITSSGKVTVGAAQVLQLGNAATTGLTAGVLAALTNATVVITDSTGQAYRIPCII